MGIFMKLPPPVPSTTPQRARFPAGAMGGRGGGAERKKGAPKMSHVTTHVPDMSYYNNRDCGCFYGASMVTLANGSSIKVQEVRRGMRLRVDSTNPNATAKILCVVETQVTGSKTSLTALPGGCVLTPWHPVRVNGVWTFPVEAEGAVTKIMACPSVFSFVLENRVGQVLVNGDECITLGHDLAGPVAGHAYFGSTLVLEDLKKCEGWASGKIRFMPDPLVRDAKTGLLTRYRT